MVEEERCDVSVVCDAWVGPIWQQGEDEDSLDVSDEEPQEAGEERWVVFSGCIVSVRGVFDIRVEIELATMLFGKGNVSKTYHAVALSEKVSDDLLQPAIVDEVGIIAPVSILARDAGVDLEHTMAIKTGC